MSFLRSLFGMPERRSAFSRFYMDCPAGVRLARAVAL